MDGSAKNSRARRLGRRTVVLLTFVAATPMWMVALGGPLTVVAPSSTDHLVVALRLASVVEAIVDRGNPVGCRHLSGLRTDRGLPCPAEAAPWEVLKHPRAV